MDRIDTDKIFLGYALKLQPDGRVVQVDEPVDMPKGYADRISEMAGGSRCRTTYSIDNPHLQVFACKRNLAFNPLHSSLAPFVIKIPTTRDAEGLDSSEILFDSNHPLTLRTISDAEVSFVPIKEKSRK